MRTDVQINGARRKVEFWTSVEYRTFLAGLVRELPAYGWEARQRFLVEQQDYRIAEGIKSRLRLRFRSYVTYPWKLHQRILREPAVDALVVCTNTFYAPAVALAAARKRRIPVIHWVFDLYPDVLIHAGKMQAAGIRDHFLGELASYAYRHAAANVFLGKSIAARARERFGPIERASLIPIGGDARPFPTPPAPVDRGRPLDIRYCGNFGRLHELHTLVRLFRGGVPEGFRFVFNGGGVEMTHLGEAVKRREDIERVVLGGALDDVEWVEAMKQSPIALVTLKSGAEGLGMPSKTYSAMVAGQAILAICPLESDLADTVRSHDAGWVVDPGHVGTLRNVLAGIAADPSLLDRKRRNAWLAGHKFYSQTVVAGEWAGLLERVVAGAAEKIQRDLGEVPAAPERAAG